MASLPCMGLMLASASLVAGCATGADIADGLEGGTVPFEDTGTSPHDGGGIVFQHDTGGVVIIGDTGQPMGCAVGTTSCSGVCVDTTTSATNCGSCGAVCSGTCTSGACVGGTTTCTAPETMCTSGCTNTSTDSSNCGTCGNACPSGQTCGGAGTAGVCGVASGCATGETSCGGVCTDTTTDPDNCGTCNTMCPSGSCTASVCDPETGDDTGTGDDSGSGGGYPGCAHSGCVTGVSLQNDCDDDGDGIVSAVCDECDPDCCKSSHSWDANCVTCAEEWCAYIGGCEFDPGCE